MGQPGGLHPVIDRIKTEYVDQLICSGVVTQHHHQLAQFGYAERVHTAKLLQDTCSAYAVASIKGDVFV